MKEIKLLSAAWYKDEQITLEFPDSWDITVLGDQILPELPHTSIKKQIENVYDIVVHIEPYGNIDKDEKFGVSNRELSD